jgi:hypothetical protein
MPSGVRGAISGVVACGVGPASADAATSTHVIAPQRAAPSVRARCVVGGRPTHYHPGVGMTFRVGSLALAVTARVRILRPSSIARAGEGQTHAHYGAAAR